MYVEITDNDGETHTFTDAYQADYNDELAFVIAPSEHNKYIRRMRKFPGGTVTECREE